MSAIIACSQQNMGKDEFCNYLITKLDSSWQRGSLANPVKDIYCQAFGVTREFIEKWKRNPEPPPGFKQNVRKGLQVIGDGFRKIKEDVWIEIALKDESEKPVISDGRYGNEAVIVRAKGGLAILLYRPEFLNDDPNDSEAEIRPVLEYYYANVVEGPISEETRKSLKYPSYDYFLINDGTLEDLYQKIDTQVIPWLKSINKI